MKKLQKEMPDLFDEGGEDEDDLSGIKLNDIHDIALGGSDWTVSAISEFLRLGAMDLTPTFQRRYAWSLEKKSRFIESLYMNLPIPQIVLAEEKSKKGRYIVIDGKQRLLTIKSYLDNDLKLLGLEFLKKLNKQTYLEISGDPSLNEYLNAFKTATIRTVVIRNWKDERLLYLMFLRLNTGSVQLSPQELRKALHPGPFLTYLDAFSEETDIFEKYFHFKKPDFRMRDVEIVLRYLSFHYFGKEYSGNLKQFLDDAVKKLNDSWSRNEAEIVSRILMLQKSFIAVEKIFGNDAFKKFTSDGYENRVNRAVVDIMTFYFSDPKIAKSSLLSKTRIKKKFEQLCTKNAKFLTSLETTTKSLEATRTRYETWGKELDKILDVNVRILRIGK